jgi:hypothetical protein
VFDLFYLLPSAAGVSKLGFGSGPDVGDSTEPAELQVVTPILIAVARLKFSRRLPVASASAIAGERFPSL